MSVSLVDEHRDHLQFLMQSTGMLTADLALHDKLTLSELLSLDRHSSCKIEQGLRGLLCSGNQPFPVAPPWFSGK